MRSIVEQTKSDEIKYKLLTAIAENPEISQRALSKHLGFSLGKVNYCLKALIERGFVKVNNFKNSNNKLAYSYLLTPKGLEEKAQVMKSFFKRKMKEYEEIKRAIDSHHIE